MKRFFLAAATAVALSAGPCLAYDKLEDRPSGEAMAFDLLIARPIGAVGTVIGAGIFLVTIPFSILMGEPPIDPAKSLVVDPFAFTFLRPLGETRIND